MSERKERTRALFKKGQKCLIPSFVYDGEMGEDIIIFEPAQVMRAEKRILDSGESTYYYLIHFVQKSKQYDSWLEESDLHRYNVELLEGGTSAAAEEARERAYRAAEAKRAQQLLSEIPQQIRLYIPAELKQVILEDYDKVVQNKCLLRLPRSIDSRPTVTEIVTEWKEKLLNSDDVVEDEQIDAIETVAESLITYFNHALRQFLLYHSEVASCDEMMERSIVPADAYGAEHLIRLFVKLPDLVSVPMMALPDDARYILSVEEHIHDLMRYMSDSKTKSKIFSAPEEYVSYLAGAKAQGSDKVPQEHDAAMQILID